MCGPSDAPSRTEFPNEHRRILEAATCARNAFFLMVEGILGDKEEDERLREAEARAAYNNDAGLRI